MSTSWYWIFKLKGSGGKREFDSDSMLVETLTVSFVKIGILNAPRNSRIFLDATHQRELELEVVLLIKIINYEHEMFKLVISLKWNKTIMRTLQFIVAQVSI